MFRADSEVTKLGAVKLKDLWADAPEEVGDASFVLTFNNNPEGEERPDEFGRSRSSSRAAHMIRLGELEIDRNTGLVSGMMWQI